MVANIRELRERWLRERWVQGEINARSRTLLGARFRDLEVAHGERPIGDLDRVTMKRWRNLIGSLAPATRRGYLSTVRMFCQWLIVEGHLETDPTADIPPIREPRRVPRARSEEEIMRLFAHAHDLRSKMILSLMVGMGLRCVEVARAEIADYDRGAATLFIRGKASNERVLPVPLMVTAAIALYREPVGWRPGSLVLAKNHAGGLGAARISALVSEILVEAQVKRASGDGITPHALRHTAASDVLDHCDNVRTVQIMLGHSSLATTQIYLRRASLGQLRTAMEGRQYGRPDPGLDLQPTLDPELFEAG